MGVICWTHIPWHTSQIKQHRKMFSFPIKLELLFVSFKIYQTRSHVVHLSENIKYDHQILTDITAFLQM